MKRLFITLCAGLLLAACQPASRPVSTKTDTQAMDWPAFDYSAATRNEGEVFKLGPDSRIDVLVRRDGPLARFGHDHVVTILSAEGLLLLASPLSESRADLRFPVSQMQVDDAARRMFYRLDTQPDADTIAATRSNMLDKVLHAEDWPEISLAFSGLQAENGYYSADLAIDVGGSRYRSRETFSMTRSADQLVIKGETTLLQSELGLEPFSALGGGLRVADRLEIHFNLKAGMRP